MPSVIAVHTSHIEQLLALDRDTHDDRACYHVNGMLETVGARGIRDAVVIDA